MKRQGMDYAEALWWLLFSAGGLALAILAPVHILFQGILAPLGIAPVVTDHYASFLNALGNPLIRIYLFVLIGPAMFHWAHRYRHVVKQLGFHWGGRYHPHFFYGVALLGTIATAYVIATAP